MEYKLNGMYRISPRCSPPFSLFFKDGMCLLFIHTLSYCIVRDITVLLLLFIYWLQMHSSGSRPGNLLTNSQRTRILPLKHHFDQKTKEKKGLTQLNDSTYYLSHPSNSILHHPVPQRAKKMDNIAVPLGTLKHPAPHHFHTSPSSQTQSHSY